MSYRIEFHYIDAAGVDHLRMTAETAHDSEIGTFSKGLEVTLRELPPLSPDSTAINLALELRDKAPGAKPSAPTPSGLWDYEMLMILQRADPEAPLAAFSLHGAHRMARGPMTSKLVAELAQLPAGGGFAERVLVRLREV